MGTFPNPPARKKRVKKKEKSKSGGGRARADKQLAQGTGKTVTQAFGSRNGSAGLAGWDAFSPFHLALPRSVAPYTVVRTTALFTSSERINIIGTFAATNSTDRKDLWTNVGLVTSNISTLAINAANNTRFRTVPFPGNSIAGSGITATPAAISVQVMNPNPLQTTAGIVAGAVCPAQLDLRGRLETWDDFGTEFISYMRPRLMSAGKLALRGIQADSYPLNMSSLSDFRSIHNIPDGFVTWDSSSTSIFPEGFAPIVIINQGTFGETHLELNLLVTVEWRVRFDIGNPAVSSHSHHGVTSDNYWDQLIRTAVDRGHGIMDIVERVASAGQALSSMGRMASKAMPMFS